MRLDLQGQVADRLGSFEVLGRELSGIKVSSSSPELVGYIRGVEDGIRESVRIEVLKDDPIFRAYRDFFWSTGIDPTKTRPASEALTRRILNGRKLPLINSFVDALNIASVETKIPFAAFDADLLAGSLELRFARSGESVLPIGHREPVSLEGKEIVISDEEKVIALYPHRDSDETKITEGTRRGLIFSCGVPGVDTRLIRGSLDRCCDTVIKFCDGVAL